MNHFTRLSVAALLAGGVIAQANAALFSSESGFGPVVEDFASFDGLVVPTPWPVLLGGGSVAASSDATFTVGAFGVDLNENGTWGAGNSFAGIGDLVNGTGSFDGSVFLTFAPAYGAGALFSLYQDVGGTATITLEAFDSAFELLESHTFSINFADPFLTNAGLFFGIGREMADIAGLRISGDGFVFDDLRVTASPVPVPAALPLLLGAVGALGVLRRRSEA